MFSLRPFSVCSIWQPGCLLLSCAVLAVGMSSFRASAEDFGFASTGARVGTVAPRGSGVIARQQPRQEQGRLRPQEDAPRIRTSHPLSVAAPVPGSNSAPTSLATWVQQLQTMQALPQGWWPRMRSRFGIARADIRRAGIVVSDGEGAGRDVTGRDVTRRDVTGRGLGRTGVTRIEIRQHAGARFDLESQGSPEGSLNGTQPVAGLAPPAPAYRTYVYSIRPEVWQLYQQVAPQTSVAWPLPTNVDGEGTRMTWRLAPSPLDASSGSRLTSGFASGEFAASEGSYSIVTPGQHAQLPMVVSPGSQRAVSGQATNERRLLFRVESRGTTISGQSIEPGLGEAITQDYWFGVECSPAPVSLQSHLGFSGGLVVDGVAPESPAEEAGIQTFDVLLKLQSVPVQTPEQLGRQIQELGEQPVRIELIRRGESLVVSAQLERRPRSSVTQAVYTYGAILHDHHDGQPMQEAIARWMEYQTEAKQNAGTLRMVLVRPGVVFEGEQIELQRGITLDQQRELRLIGRRGQPLDVVLQDQQQAVKLTAELLPTLPGELREVVDFAKGRFHWLEGPVEVGQQSVQFFPERPMVEGLPRPWHSDSVLQNSAAQQQSIQVRVERDAVPVVEDAGPFRIRKIELKPSPAPKVPPPPQPRHGGLAPVAPLPPPTATDLQFEATIRRLEEDVQRLQRELEQLRQEQARPADNIEF